MSASAESKAAAPPVAPALRLALVAVVAGYVALALGYALATPKWNAPDEPAHFNYVAEVATTGRLPVIQAGDWDAGLLERSKATQFRAADVRSIRYEGHQPPLYYLLAAPVYLATAGLGLDAQVFALRALSALFGALLLLVAHRAARLLFPAQPPLWVAVPAVVAFIPMHTAMSAAVNNDLLAELLGSLLLLALLRGLGRGFDGRAALQLGALGGLCLLTKLTLYGFVALLVPGWLVWDGLRRGAARDPAERFALATRLAAAVGLALLIAAPWLLRNASVYGPDDLLAARRHDAVVVGQPRWERFDAAAAQTFLTVLFQSFWGQFGWMGIVLDQRLYLAFGLLGGLGALGLALELARRAAGGQPGAARGATHPGASDQQLVALGAAVLIVFGQVVYYNLSFIQAQGRYLFPAIVPIAALLCLGWWRLAGATVPFRWASDAPEPAFVPLPGGRSVALGAGLALAGALVAFGEAFGLLGPAPIALRALYPGAVALGLTGAVLLRPAAAALVGFALLPTSLAALDLVALTRFVAPYFVR